MNIITISAGSNCYLISQGEHHLMIDAGAPEMGDKIEKKLAQHQIAMEQIRYLVLTHGHSDHIGSAAIFQKKYGIPIVIHQNDITMIDNPFSQQMQATHPIGKMITWLGKGTMKRNPPQSFTPDLIITGPQTNRLGFGETIHPLPGHTRGSMVISFPSGELFVGDILMHMLSPQPAYLWEDHAALQKSIQAVQQLPAKTIYYGHGRPTPASKIGQ
ncbi:MBL fold metallo-hydrolase [Acetobacterium wieringae]|uniref:MBL fold metallo-hydrolase n=1 Tax=Acetobacterium wieringae TaxID=52694 RepID=A0A5D0WSX4_9FIRM|nr:MBL fold metallo-hydrolase [Acetobacterium wieringae]TYC87106.1 MBL fold metallo-hydrolase [Acetobacterium wieringae]